ncbi:energy transducer TonB [Natronospira bacteriovora]|uniref:Protein TonB n=1 Tax=Natronospira bacteriovora TaxID=3069753 RepID=A0ABU0W7Q6_9GAMM|nr:energy transducer TonB [Natronospira sp. AB-CW4]MDQ2070070.1 energy transducer TonB [Natronospira sp. AB-CW4]
MRLFTALLLAVLVSVSLFIFMHGLIATDEEPAVEVVQKRVDVFHRQHREERVEPRPRVMPEPPEELQPPMPETVSVTPTETTRFEIETPDMPDLSTISNGVSIGTPSGRGVNGGDGDAIPVVRVEPQWPREALIQGIEGWVRLEFTIRSDGSVGNIRVIESTPARLFDQAAVRALQRWRFRPRMVDGRPVERQATQVIEFSLSE